VASGGDVASYLTGARVLAEANRLGVALSVEKVAD
jgi:hypothetical protein